MGNSVFAKKLILSCLFSFVFSVYCYPQFQDPSAWAGRIHDAGVNVLVQDTFLFQSFEGDRRDNWDYTFINGEEYIFDASAAGYPGQGGKHSLWYKPQTTPAFDRIDLSAHQQAKVSFLYGTTNFGPDTDLFVYFKYEQGNSNLMYCIQTTKESTSPLHYRAEGTVGGEKVPNPFVIDAQSYRIHFSSRNTKGHFFLDSILCYGLIPAYTLFTGKGQWAGKTNWSHLPAERHRKALIAGEVTVGSYADCHSVALNGSLSVEKGGSLSCDSLLLYDDVSLLSEGELEVRQAVTVHKTFPQKGKWYFVSFPFDVYLSDVDPAFEMKDNQPNNGGNYFYAMAYNGERRNQSNSTSGNWSVLSPGALDGGLLFEKNKGYLFALDAAAGRTSLSFSSAPVGTSSGFAGKAVVRIPATLGGTGRHAGWHLCGNPFPAPLSLAAFPKDPQLDNYIYVYNGKDYTAYPIGSNYQLPPFSAFFVKAKGAAELVFDASAAAGSKAGAMIQTSSLSFTGVAEPAPGQDPAGLERIYTKGKTLHIEQLSRNGNVSVYDVAGILVWQKSVVAGSSSHALPVSNGIYIVRVDSPAFCGQYKCVINQ